MPKLRDSSHFAPLQYFQKNLSHSLETNYDEINNVNLEGNWSLLDHMSIYVKVIDNNNSDVNDVNKNDQEEEEEEEIVAKQRNPSEGGEYVNPLSSPYNSSWVPEQFSSNPIISKYSLFESNDSNSQLSNILQNDES